MAIAVVRPRAHYERGFAHSYERRAPQAGASQVAPLPATPVNNGTEATAASNPETALANGLPTDVKALVGLIAFLGLFILAVAIWKIRVWRRHRMNPPSKSNSDTTPSEKHTESSFRIDLESAKMETPDKAVLKPTIPSASAGVTWVPQMRTDVPLSKPTRKRSKRVVRLWEKNLAEFMAATTSDRGPPPSYVVKTFPIPTVPESPSKRTFPHTPMKPTPGRARASSFNLYPVPLPSNEKKLPRLMSVTHAYKLTLEDELTVSVGETIRLLQVYEDEWCLVQRVGRMDAEKGVIPRICLKERPEVVPIVPGLPSSASYHVKTASLPS